MMLAEKDINPMRPWDMELPKFINDTRYKGVKNLRERKDLFDEHCKHLIREKRAKKRNEGETKVNVSLFMDCFIESQRLHSSFENSPLLLIAPFW